ncbi:protein tonB [Lysobacter sp. TAF61]|uniref:energy transducer TonB n=1 Tax=Lysobacter sp. TAF61 TaxID=3233072 RepID=UPI003F95E8FA
MARQGWLALALVLLGTVAQSQAQTRSRAPEEVRKQIVVTMLVTGTVDIERDGSVSGHAVDKVDALPESVVQLVDAAVATWRFDPVMAAGQAVAARNHFSLRVVGNQGDNGDFSLKIAGVSFGKGDDEGIPTRRGRLAPPRYPQGLAQGGIGGTVYLIVRIGRDGSVEDVIARQVNLRVAARPKEMERFRKEFADVCVTKARQWKFDPPKKGEDVAASSWSVRIPVDFYAPDRPQPAYGHWEAYVPGPRVAVPWRDNADDARDPVDAIAAGGVYSDNDTGPRLLTPAGQG